MSAPTTRLEVGGEIVTVEVARAADQISGDDRLPAGTVGYDVRVDGRPYFVAVVREGESWRISLSEREEEPSFTLTVVRDGPEVWVATDGEVYRCRALTETEAQGSVAPGVRSPRVVAPMPGKVLDVLVRANQEVAAGEPLVVLEAMKMETVATAEAAARVVRVEVAPGEMVEPGQMLVELEFS